MNNHLEVCLITVDSPILHECKKALEKTGFKGKVNIIRNVKPMAAAFDRMKDYSKGEWTLQLDEDMLLHENAMELIDYSITKAEQDKPGEIGEITFLLNDHFFEETIGHLKVWRTDVLRKLSFRDMKGGDRDFTDRMRIFLGLTIMHTNVVIAEHTEKMTPQSAYSRMRDMIQKQRRYGWTASMIFDFLSSKFSRCRDEISFMALAGAFDGLMIRDGTELVSKRSKEDLRRPSYLLAQQYWFDREKAVHLNESEQKKRNPENLAHSSPPLSVLTGS